MCNSYWKKSAFSGPKFFYLSALTSLPPGTWNQILLHQIRFLKKIAQANLEAVYRLQQISS